MPRRLMLPLLLLMTGISARSAIAGDGSAGSVIFILDCSASMGDAEGHGSPLREASIAAPRARLDAAKDMLHKLVADAVRNDYKVGVVLYGHRMMWTDDSDTPGVQEQTEYFARTGSFNSLMNLIPGEDVERIQSLKRMGAPELMSLSQRLEAVQAWGEKPLYLALVHATAEMADQPLGATKSIVVLTSGSNQQRLANRETSMADVQNALDRSRIAVNFINFGSEDDVAAQSALGLIAKATRGKVTSALEEETELSFASLVLDGAEQEEREVAGVASMVSTAAMPKPRDQLLEGVILYYGRPVTRGTIMLEPSSAGEIEIDAEGRFKFSRVMPGTYKMAVRAIAKNKIRQKTIEIVVEDRPQREAFVTVDVK